MREGDAVSRPVRNPEHPLALLRRERGWSQLDLAIESGLGPNTISHLENRDHTPHRSTVVLIAHTLGIPRDELARLLR